MIRSFEPSLRPGRPAARSVLVTALLAAAGLTVGVPFGREPSRAAAHEVPPHATVRAFVTVEDGRLRLLVRVPMETLRDVPFPLRGPGYLDLERIDSELRHAARMWVADYVDLYEGERRLEGETVVAARASLPSDRSFRSWEAALAHVTGPPLPDDTELIWKQAYLDVLVEVPVRSTASRFSIDPKLGHLAMRTETRLSWVAPDGSERVFRYSGDPGRVRLDPRWHQAAVRFLEAGVRQLLGGLDHLLFLLCLVIPFRKPRELVPVAGAFAVAVSLPLAGSALGLGPEALWVPPLAGTLTAASVLYAAVANVFRPRLGRRWPAAFGFGLAHGAAFALFLEGELQFAGSHAALSVASFDLGLVVGTLLALAVAVPLLEAAMRWVRSERLATIVLSALVGHEGWHRTVDRGAQLVRHRFEAPALDLAFLAAAMRWAAAALVVLGVAWGLAELFRRWGLTGPEDERSGEVGSAEPRSTGPVSDSG